jgi:hypothetical protein
MTVDRLDKPRSSLISWLVLVLLGVIVVGSLALLALAGG